MSSHSRSDDEGRKVKPQIQSENESSDDPEFQIGGNMAQILKLTQVPLGLKMIVALHDSLNNGPRASLIQNHL